VIIPAAGYATRLYPLTKDKPKALLVVKGKPILEHIIRRIEELPGVESITIVSNAVFYPAFAQWLKGFKSKIPLAVIDDGTKSNEDRLGQIGDIQLAIEKAGIDDDLLLVSGDNLFNFSLRPAFEFFQ
jgi:glucose-1-phosphate thymidylyltransferase